ncbi:MAG: hypothetical protein J5794_08425, partial [Lachnospiraceae bacterium]|nr:hypothetical protein [Lachnospiraceae bacterium]
MKKRTFAAILAMILAFALAFAGCTEPVGSTEVPGTKTEQAANESTEGQTESGETLPEGVPSAAELAEGLSGVFKPFSGTPAEPTKLDTSVLEALASLRGGFIPTIEINEPEQLTNEQAAEMDRAVRAYTKPEEDIIVNNSEFYYFYDQLDEEQQAIYDALELFAHDPTTQENVVSVKIKSDPTTQEFGTVFYTVLAAMCYDHPELWWMYLWNGTVEFGAYINQDNDGGYTLYFQFTKLYETFEQDVKVFNKAVEEFLDGIHTNASDRAIAKEVHDKLIEMAIYDYDVLQNSKNDFAHTAFGPLVGNSSGTPHYCVCDGYSQAYEYLLTQLGIPATVVTGMAGNAGADGGMGGHAWSLVVLDGCWYEVDSTWNDFTDLKNDVAANYSPSSTEYQVYMELLNDEDYMEKVQHYMYLLMTKDIENYKVTDDLTYTTRNGMYVVSLVGDSERQRFCDYSETKDNFQGRLNALLPQADGTILPEFETESGNTDEPE